MRVQELATKIKQQCNTTDEVKDLCFELDINYDDIEGVTRQDKIRALVQYCERHGRLNALENFCE